MTNLETAPRCCCCCFHYQNPTRIEFQIYFAKTTCSVVVESRIDVDIASNFVYDDENLHAAVILEARANVIICLN